MVGGLLFLLRAHAGYLTKQLTGSSISVENLACLGVCCSCCGDIQEQQRHCVVLGMHHDQQHTHETSMHAICMTSCQSDCWLCVCLQAISIALNRF